MAYKLQQYIDDAQSAPFPLELLDGSTLEIPAPDVETLMQLGETPIQDNRRILKLLLGEHHDTVWLEIAGKPAGLAAPLVIDLLRHFKISNLMSLPGGSHVSSG